MATWVSNQKYAECATELPRPSRLDEAYSTLMGLAEHARKCGDAAKEIADRSVGHEPPVPTPDRSAKLTEVNRPLLQKIEEAMNAIGSELQRAQDQINRLQVL